MITQERLRQVLDYDPGTGIFRWKVSVSRKCRAGRIAGTKPRDGYQDIRVDGSIIRAHRIAWLFVNGQWPSGFLDHINGNRYDNRICNLRLATQTQNNANQKISRRNKSGFKGVSFCKTTGLWRATVASGGKQRTIGRFACPAAAHAAYMAAATDLFGQFARAS